MKSTKFFGSMKIFLYQRLRTRDIRMELSRLVVKGLVSTMLYSFSLYKTKITSNAETIAMPAIIKMIACFFFSVGLLLRLVILNFAFVFSKCDRKSFWLINIQFYTD